MRLNTMVSGCWRAGMPLAWLHFNDHIDASRQCLQSRACKGDQDALFKSLARARLREPGDIVCGTSR
jgi:hypothetical protein